ncbi:diacylglycerol/lipid kinase family protein [Blastococcus sp. VKM Ac-2987]|uniref:diacylglycerol/lipid kinase family protein n=1 Tax=Blastococcus sp. VKM Ac-2987 TaxID=3004141 RepID=UPI0022AB9D88|nr:diacylglycerol kinase family protein [Blastococcus sp. VKM Ac-2987]MCZ2861266.1 diacylglycerol kinase family protein [Blastococcus sp. VKM Ac-2987]
MTSFDRIVIVFNPQSTGNAPESAEELRSELADRLAAVPLELSPTHHAGHARDLAREAAGSGSPLIVSVSGDGGYNEVVNGVMDAGNDRAVCAVRAAGNANDHRRTTREGPLADAIVAGDVRRIDLLRLTVGSGPDAWVRYAHSYIGVGLTPVVAVDLEKGGKGSWREIVSVVRGFSRFHPHPIELESGRRRRIDSLVFANIAEMAKYAKLSDDGTPDDGRFEVITEQQTGKLRVLAMAVRAATRGLGPQPRATHYAFTTLAPMPLQLDGELVELDAGTLVSVDIAPGALATIF